MSTRPPCLGDASLASFSQWTFPIRRSLAQAPGSQWSPGQRGHPGLHKGASQEAPPDSLLLGTLSDHPQKGVTHGLWVGVSRSPLNGHGRVWCRGHCRLTVCGAGRRERWALSVPVLSCQVQIRASRGEGTWPPPGQFWAQTSHAPPHVTVQPFILPARVCDRPHGTLSPGTLPGAAGPRAFSGVCHMDWLSTLVADLGPSRVELVLRSPPTPNPLTLWGHVEWPKPRGTG